jgi:hypothetical protein
MRADGTIPFVANKCNFSGFFDPTSNWYGGGGITVNGAGNQVMTNTVAGMFNGGTDASARPPAIKVLGASGNDILNNIVGKDTAGYEAGVCGLAIDVSGNRHDILDNQIFDGGIAETGAGFTEGSIFINESSFTFNQMTVRRNLVKDGQGLVIEFGPAVNSSNPIRKFNPGRVTDISGTSVQGTNGIYVDPLGIAPDDVNECPGCTIDLYADDLDGLQETLELLATTVADGNGNWSATLSRALTSNEGLRTQSTTQAAETITGYGPNTSTAVSVLYVAPLDIQLQQPANVTANIEATFVITVTPGQVTLPLTFTVESDEHTPIVAALNTNVASLSAYSWPTPGTKTMTITAENEIGSVTKLFTINVADDSNSDPDDFAIYLPLLIK